jgi:hypothetical protein
LPLLFPTASVHRVTDITLNILRKMHVKALLVDIDNTLALPESQTPLPGTLEWSRRLRTASLRIILMSNNSEERVQPFAEQYGLPFSPASLKPLPGAFLHAAQRLGAGRGETAVVGDQIYTDILGANLAGMKSILTDPIFQESSLSFQIRRKLEKPVRGRIRKQQTCRFTERM